MTTDSPGWRRQIEEVGYTVLPGVFAAEAEVLADELAAAIRARAGDASIRDEGGTVYAARNLVDVWPAARSVWRRPALLDVLTAVLGPHFGLVRTLFFDKPPGQSWALPWHKDLTIAVRDNRLPSPHFTHPTRKAGVPHVEAPLAVLEGMLTARVHLDDTTEENGALQVVPGSHRSGKALTLDAAPLHMVLAARGDVLLMRPLLAHCSAKSHPETARHRRVVHLEFAASPELADGYAWHDFVPGWP
jgi:ectoine hydroxylase-related dioxygenase (phytanoyl-CoA dioxygenase family)